MFVEMHQLATGRTGTFTQSTSTHNMPNTPAQNVAGALRLSHCACHDVQAFSSPQSRASLANHKVAMLIKGTPSEHLRFLLPGVPNRAVRTETSA